MQDKQTNNLDIMENEIDDIVKNMNDAKANLNDDEYAKYLNWMNEGSLSATEAEDEDVEDSDYSELDDEKYKDWTIPLLVEEEEDDVGEESNYSESDDEEDGEDEMDGEEEHAKYFNTSTCEDVQSRMTVIKLVQTRGPDTAVKMLEAWKGSTMEDTNLYKELHNYVVWYKQCQNKKKRRTN
jgi:hypothetical protein